MWVPGTWESEEDIERDLLLLAEYCIPTPEDLEEKNTRVPDTIIKYRRQMAENLAKPLNSDIDEGMTYIVSGRGKGIKDRVIRPGEPIESHPLDEIELMKQIREVSGLGYSNELIEESIKARNRSPEQSSSYEPMFKLIPSGSSSSESSINTSTHSNDKEEDAQLLNTSTDSNDMKEDAQLSPDNASGLSTGAVTSTKTEQDNKDMKNNELVK